MIKLKQITLCALGSTNVEGMINALKYSSREIEWGAVKLITPTDRQPVKFSPLDKYNFLETHHINPLNSIDEWNKAIVFDLHKYIDTPFALLVHPDGFVINSQSWRREFLDYDFIGAPWPYPQDDYSYRDVGDDIIRVGNSVSLRSKKLLELPTKLNLPFTPYYGNTNEDGYVCVHMRHNFLKEGIKYAPIEIAKWFSRELEIPENIDVEKPFCFHMADVEEMKGRNKAYDKIIT